MHSLRLGARSRLQFGRVAMPRNPVTGFAAYASPAVVGTWHLGDRSGSIETNLIGVGRCASPGWSSSRWLLSGVARPRRLGPPRRRPGRRGVRPMLCMGRAGDCDTGGGCGRIVRRCPGTIGTRYHSCFEHLGQCANSVRRFCIGQKSGGVKAEAHVLRMIGHWRNCSDPPVRNLRACDVQGCVSPLVSF